MKITGKVLGHLLTMALTVVSLQAFAAAPNTAGRDFNHSTTSFALTGAHATAACETCHVGGVFKGTERNCDGCHALGKRVVATPKSTSHIVTDAPCDTCHFNTSTFLGARFNHGTAQPGKCSTCHNGRLTMTKPPSHNTGSKATESCDKCHRTYAWLPATWNHTGAGSCDQAGCHLAGSNTYFRGSGPSHIRTGMLTYACTDCHNYFGWSPARYKHNTGAACSSCHNGTIAVGKSGGHVATTDECSQCHTSTASWLGALGAKPANHILYNGGVQCSSCHTGGGIVTGATLHAYVSPVCKTCHDSGSAVTTILGVTGRKRLGNHEGSNTSQDCTSCHARQYNQWNNP
ncbi:MAG: cytochrome c3 family protein [Nitrosomonadales bacterium]|nr:cytochrome c3 family protein [Nitrosomonadales bacterium]